jgi:hypothetical protein
LPVTRNLEAEDRRPAIAEAVIPVFARHGLNSHPPLVLYEYALSQAQVDLHF